METGLKSIQVSVTEVALFGSWDCMMRPTIVF